MDTYLIYLRNLGYLWDSADATGTSEPWLQLPSVDASLLLVTSAGLKDALTGKQCTP